MMQFSQNPQSSQREGHKKGILALVKVALFLLFAAVIIVFGSIAWFTMNREAENSNMQMTSSDLPFEIKTTGTVATNSSLLGALGFKDGLAVTGGYSSSGRGDIKWMLSADDTMAASGLSPGTQGALHFTVCPLEYNNAQNLAVTYTLNLKAYKLTAAKKEQIAEISNRIANEELDENDQPYTMPTVTLDDMIQLSADPEDENYSKALDYIQGHILVFKNADNTGRIEFGQPQTFVMSCAADQEIPMHWVWPETLGNMVSSGTSTPNVCTGAEKTALITHIQEHPALYFPMGNFSADMLDENQHLNSNVLGTDLVDYYPILNLAYNNADQVIGTEAQYIMLELVVDGTLR